MSMTENEAKVWLQCIANMKLAYDRAKNSRKKACEIAIQAIEEIQQYRAIGTIEEFRDLKEKSVAKKVCIPPCNICYKEDCDCQCEHLGDTYRDAYRCPSCKSDRVYMSEYDLKYDYCPNCGQAVDWSEG